MSHLLEEVFVHLSQQIELLSIEDALNTLSLFANDKLTFSTSFSNEDQVLTDILVRSNTPVNIFTLDTGRLFEETYDTWHRTKVHYNIQIKAFFPEAGEVSSFLQQHGPNSFYESVDLRKECCSIRKILPLGNALKGQLVWITGLRAEHSLNRTDLKRLEWDEVNQIIKFNPLVHWTTEDVKEYILANKVPFNPLTEKGFVSIGCAPCTRAINTGEDFRAGRWWWEENSKKECGLHINPKK